MLGQTQNALLQQTEQSIQSKVPTNLQAAFQRTLTAGLTIMYTPKLQAPMMQAIQGLTDIAQGAATGAANLLGMLYKQSNQKMPMTIAIPVGMSLMCEFLDLMEKTGKGQVTSDLIAQATQDTSQAIMQLFGISPGKVQQMAQANSQGAASASPAAPAAPQSKGLLGASVQGAQ